VKVEGLGRDGGATLVVNASEGVDDNLGGERCLVGTVHSDELPAHLR
jgi:hypothetical protein